MSRRAGQTSGRRDLAVGAVVFVVLAAVTALAALSANGVPGMPSSTLRATLPAGSPALQPGDEVRVAGRRTGLVLAVGRTPDGRQRVRFRTDGGTARRDARLVVRMRSPAGGWYLALERGEGEPLPEGAEIAPASVRFAEDLPAVVDGLGHATLRNLSQTTRLAGAGLAGRGTGLQRGITGLDDTLEDVTGLLRAATARDALPALVRGAGTTADALTGREDDDAGRLLTATAALAGVLADRGTRLDETLRALPGAEAAVLEVGPRLDRTLARVRSASLQLRPGVRALREALPDAVAVLGEGPRLRREARALRRAGEPALAALRPVLRRVGPSAVLLRQTLPPLGDLTAHLARYEREFEAGSVGYYIAALYKPRVGKAPGYPIAPAMTTLTCASGSNPSLEPGDVFTDRLDRPCR